MACSLLSEERSWHMYAQAIQSLESLITLELCSASQYNQDHSCKPYNPSDHRKFGWHLFAGQKVPTVFLLQSIVQSQAGE